MADDLLGNELSETESLLLEAYETLKRLCAEDLPPTAATGVRAALAQLAQPLASLGLVYEHLPEHDL